MGSSGSYQIQIAIKNIFSSFIFHFLKRILYCYESQFSNMELLSKKSIQLPAIYRIRPGNGTRICQGCIDNGFCKTHYSNGIEIQWNGFMLFYNGDYKTTDVVLDIAGHRFAF